MTRTNTLPCQAGILLPLPPLARYLQFQLAADADPTEALSLLDDPAFADGDQTVTAIGLPLVTALGRSIPGLRPLGGHPQARIQVPHTPAALWIWLRGTDRGQLLHRARDLEARLATHFDLETAVDSFMYEDSRDLTGYIDGTENPTDDDAVTAAIAQQQGAGLDGGSIVSVQQWLHDLDHFADLPADEQDHVFGRALDTNEELDDAPASAHVKRTAQESFSPEAFVVRRSMPWTEAMDAGLMFVAFGATADPFEALLGRMVGAEDGITDALFRFSRPLTGAHFWCPPLRNGRLDLSRLRD